MYIIQLSWSNLKIRPKFWHFISSNFQWFSKVNFHWNFPSIYLRFFCYCFSIDFKPEVVILSNFLRNFEYIKSKVFFLLANWCGILFCTVLIGFPVRLTKFFRMQISNFPCCFFSVIFRSSLPSWIFTNLRNYMVKSFGNKSNLIFFLWF